jgi:cytochrome P450
MSAESDAPPINNIDFDHTDPEFVRSPYRTFRDLHARCPVARSSKFGGFWVLSKYADVVAAARDTETFSSAQGISIPVFASLVPLVPIESDPPLHSEFRRTLQREFSRGRMESLEGSIRNLANELIDGFVDRGSADLATELAAKLPGMVLAELMGFLRSEGEWFRSHTQRLIETSKVGDSEGNMAASVSFAGNVAQALDERRREPRDDMLTRIVTSEIEGRPITEVEALGMTLVTVIAGHETTVGGIGSLFMYVGGDPELKGRLLADPSLVPKAVEEAIRLEAPIQGAARTVLRDVCVRGQSFSSGDKVWLLYAASNRDEEHFPEPDKFDLDRKPNRHLGFGEGVHRCVGAPLAQIELRVVLEEVLKRIPTFRVDDWDTITFDGSQSRTIARLPVSW